MPNMVSHPDEVIVLKRRFGQGAANIDRYLELDGYKAVQKAIDLGPEGGECGGQLLAEGPPRIIAETPESETGRWW